MQQDGSRGGLHNFLISLLLRWVEFFCQKFGQCLLRFESAHFIVVDLQNAFADEGRKGKLGSTREAQKIAPRHFLEQAHIGKSKSRGGLGKLEIFEEEFALLGRALEVFKNFIEAILILKVGGKAHVFLRFGPILPRHFLFHHDSITLQQTAHKR